MRASTAVENEPGTGSISTGVLPVALVTALATTARGCDHSGRQHLLPMVDTMELILRAALVVPEVATRAV